MIACDVKCPGGNRCRLDGEVRHELHMCNMRNCYCHSAERYAEARRASRNKPARETQPGRQQH